MTNQKLLIQTPMAVKQIAPANTIPLRYARSTWRKSLRPWNSLDNAEKADVLLHKYMLYTWKKPRQVIHQLGLLKKLKLKKIRISLLAWCGCVAQVKKAMHHFEKRASMSLHNIIFGPLKHCISFPEKINAAG